MRMTESKDDEKTSNVSIPEDSERYLIELEFVQSLANMRYLHFLAQNKYFDNKAFMNYLKYLRYWKQPEYSRHLVFPQCLRFLDALIDDDNFRREISFGPYVEFCHQQQGLHWQFDDTSKR